MTNSTLTDAQHRALHEATELLGSMLRESENGDYDQQAFGGGLTFSLDLIEAVLANDDARIKALFHEFYKEEFDAAYARADQRQGN